MTLTLSKTKQQFVIQIAFFFLRNVTFHEYAISQYEIKIVIQKSTKIYPAYPFYEIKIKLYEME